MRRRGRVPPVAAGISALLMIAAHDASLERLLQRSPAMLPISGTSSIAHLEENLASASRSTRRKAQ